MKKFLMAKRMALLCAVTVVCATLISTVSVYANSEEAGTVCLVVDVIKTRHAETRGKGCYTNNNGEDKLEGYEATCYPNDNNECYPKSCKTEKPCYTK